MLKTFRPHDAPIHPTDILAPIVWPSVPNKTYAKAKKVQ